MPKSEKLAPKGKGSTDEKPAEKKLSRKELREQERRLERAPIRNKREYKPFHKSNLGEQIEDPENAGVRTVPRQVKRKRNQEEEDEVLTAKMSGRILKAARDQQEEIDAEELDEEREGEGGRVKFSSDALAAALKKIEDSDEEDGDDDDGPGSLFRDGDSVYEPEDDEEVDPNDAKALEAFMAPEGHRPQQMSLGDLIMSKIRDRQKEACISVVPSGAEDADADAIEEGMDEKVVQVYKSVGRLLTRYTVGKIPKAFKIIPNLKNWEEILYLTEPDTWTPQAMFEATKLFVSNMNARLAQRFLALVLLPRLRRDIKEDHKLHLSLFQAMKKAAYKPGAFYKGLLLPLCQSQTCTLREAFIFSSVLRRTSIPVLHSAAALLRMAQMEYCGTTSFFIRTLLDKKYALPYRVIDSLADHFLRFADDERQVPVVWHQSLLCFIQRYKDEIRPEDKESIRKLCSLQHHYQVSPEIVRELDHGMARGGVKVAMAMDVQLGKNVNEVIKSLPPVPMNEDD